MGYDIALEQFGLNKKEIKIYTALLQMGAASIQEIVRKTKIKRTTTYSVLENLIQKNLVLLNQKGNKREYVVEDPQKIVSILESKQKDLQDRKSQLLDLLPQIKSLYNVHAKKPKVRFYEGRDDIQQVFEELLQIPRGSEVVGYTSAEEITKSWVSDFAQYFRNQRVKNGIIDRTIAEDAPFTRGLQKNDKAELRNMVLISPSKFPLSGQINIFENKVLICSWVDEIVLVIESGPVADDQRSLFELAWAGAQKLGKPSPNPYRPTEKK
jgi:sugar-specific transcriptional regulator TrmB